GPVETEPVEARPHLGRALGDACLHAVRREGDAVAVEPDVDELVAREPRRGDDRGRLAVRDLEPAPVEGEPAPGEGLRLAQERDVVHGDDEREVAYGGDGEARRVHDVDVEID